MHVSFLPYLVDPLSGEALGLHIDRADGDRVIEGRLTASTASYPIVRGVPRFAGETGYVNSFGTQWKRWPRLQFDSANAGGPMAGYTRRMWESITGVAGELAGAVLADFGCGAGRFLEIVRAKRRRVIGIELSAAADVAAQSFERDDGVLVCQGDVLRPPVAAASLDAAFSIGVLHHTPDPHGGFRAMAATVRPGGWVAVSVYPRGGYYDSARVRLFRRLFGALGNLAGPASLLAYARGTALLSSVLGGASLPGRIVRRVLPFVALPDRRWSALDTYDSLSPVYQSTHDSSEVASWFDHAGLEEVQPSAWGTTSWRGRRPRAAAAQPRGRS